MKTKEEIFAHEYLKQIGCLDNRGVKEEFLEQIKNGAHQYAFEAMDEYAKQQALAFDRYKRKGLWEWSVERQAYFKWINENEQLTRLPVELYAQFIESQNKGK